MDTRLPLLLPVSTVWRVRMSTSPSHTRVQIPSKWILYSECWLCMLFMCKLTHISSFPFHVLNLFCMRHGDKENEWGSVSLEEITWCCWLFFWTSKRNTELPDSQWYCLEDKLHRENLLCLPSSLNSEMGDGSWQTLWSTSVNIRSSQPRPPQKKENVLEVSCSV